MLTLLFIHKQITENIIKRDQFVQMTSFVQIVGKNSTMTLSVKNVKEVGCAILIALTSTNRNSSVLSAVASQML